MVLLGCGDDDAAGGKIVAIGAVIDQSGSIARPEWRDAAFLAVSDANAGLARAGGFHDLQFRLEFSDSTNVTMVAVQRALELYRTRNIKGLVSDTSGDSLALFRTNYDDDPSNDLPIPMICMACTSPNINDPNAMNMDPVSQNALRNGMKWNFRVSTNSDPEAVALLQAVHALAANGDRNADGVFKISIEVIDDQYGNGFFLGFERARDRLFPGLILEKVLHPREVDVNAHDWAGDLGRLTDDRNEQTGMMDGQPDAIIEVTFPLYAAALTKAYVEAGATVTTIPFIHHHNWRHNQTLTQLAATNIEGQIGVSHAIVDNCATSGTTFWNEMVAQTSKAPGFWDAQTYDAVFVQLLATLVAIQNNGITDPTQMTPAQLRDALFLVNDKSAGAVQVHVGPDGFAAAVAAVQAGQPIDYVGASGPLDFDEWGNLTGNFVKFQVMGGRFVDLETYDCVTNNESCPIVPGACNP